MMDTKICSKCLTEKLLDDFYPRKRYKFNRDSVCKNCISIKNKSTKLTKEQLEKNKKKSEEFRKNNPEKFKWIVKNSIYKKLGLKISKEEYDKMLLDQKGLCLICEKPPTGFKKSLCLDHCHKTLKVRGLLCDNCNAGLGKFKESPELLNKAFLYLKSFKTWDGY